MKLIKLFRTFVHESSKEFLNESKIDISSTILDVLKNLISSSSREEWVKWANLILSAARSEVDYPNNEIEYLYYDSGKIFQEYRGKQQEIKLGKALQKILVSIEPEIIIDQGEFGDFVNFIGGKLKDSHQDEYQLVSGDDIAKYYDINNTNIVEGTTLYKSCMRDKDPNTFNLYTKNSDVISLLVRLDEGKASTRALVWKLDGQGGVDYFVDRIYSNDEPIKKIGGIEKFIESKFPGKKYVIKQNNENWISNVDIKLKLRYLDFTLYPFVDTFSYLYFPYENWDMGKFSVKLNTSGGFLSNREEWQRYPEYLCFRLYDHVKGSREPFNCKIVDEKVGIYHYLGNADISDILYFLKKTKTLDYDTAEKLFTRVNSIFDKKTRDYKNFDRDEIIFQILSKHVQIKVENGEGIMSPRLSSYILFSDKKYYVKILQKFKKFFGLWDLWYLLEGISRGETDSKDIIESMALSLDEGLSIDTFILFDKALQWSLSDEYFNPSGGWTIERKLDESVWSFNLEIPLQGLKKNHRLYFDNSFEFYFKNKLGVLCEYMCRFDMDSGIGKKINWIIKSSGRIEFLNFLDILYSRTTGIKEWASKVLPQFIDNLAQRLSTEELIENNTVRVSLVSILSRDQIVELFDKLNQKGYPSHILNNEADKWGIENKRYKSSLLKSIGHKIKRFSSFRDEK